MANYHLSIKIFSRGKGASVIEKAAYRSGEKLLSDYNGELYDYTRKGGVAHTEILLPDYAPREYANRSVLWNAVENSERNGNAQLAREMEFSLPRELSIEQNINLAREFAQNTFVSAGMCADVCVRDKGDGNPHAHIMLTLRPFNEDGTWGAKSKKEYVLDNNGERIRLPSGEYKSRKVYTVDWNEQTKAEGWRAAWADTANAALSLFGITETLDHRSYERQGIDKVPSVHLGPAASQMERKGIKTDRGDINRAVEITNSQFNQQRARIKKANDWLYAVPIQDAPTMVEMMTHVADAKNLKNRWQNIRNLQTKAKVLIFQQENDISDFGQFADKVMQMLEKHYALANTIKEKTRRLGTLEKHLEQYEIQKQTKSIHKKYQELDPKKREGYKAKHSEEIRLYKESADYFKAVMNGRKDPLPIKSWKKEREMLTTEKYALCDEYYKLNDEIKYVEALRRSAESIMRESVVVPERAAAKSRRMEL